jgi:hypothetical protein
MRWAIKTLTRAACSQLALGIVRVARREGKARLPTSLYLTRPELQGRGYGAWQHGVDDNGSGNMRATVAALASFDFDQASSDHPFAPSVTG